MDNSEQYVLIARIAGNYLCYSCERQDSVYLNEGETWKIGVNRKGEKVRYPDGKKDPRLQYFVQFKGDYGECLRQEKIKIYWYVSSPENIKRIRPLRRPPGNKIRR